METVCINVEILQHLKCARIGCKHKCRGKEAENLNANTNQVLGGGTEQHESVEGGRALSFVIFCAAMAIVIVSDQS